MNTIFIDLELIIMSPKQRRKLQRDMGQIRKMAQLFEQGTEMVPIQVRTRLDGKYDLYDGRHRFLAAELAEFGQIEAIVVM